MHPEDIALVKRLRTDGVLEDVDAHLINGGDGKNVVVMCADGHQSVDTISAHANFLRAPEQGECCCHTLSFNGGALNLSPKFSPRSRLPVRKVLLSQIRQAMALKSATTIVLYVHAPCGAAKLRKLSFSQVLDHLFLAKTTVKQRFARRKNLRLICFVQIDYSEEKKKRTYRISRKKWQDWKMTNASAA